MSETARPGLTVEVQGHKVGVRRLPDGSWSAWITVGPSEGATAEEAVRSCLEKARSAFGLRFHGEATGAALDLLRKLADVP